MGMPALEEMTSEQKKIKDALAKVQGAWVLQEPSTRCFENNGRIDCFREFLNSLAPQRVKVFRGNEGEERKLSGRVDWNQAIEWEKVNGVSLSPPYPAMEATAGGMVKVRIGAFHRKTLEEHAKDRSGGTYNYTTYIELELTPSEVAWMLGKEVLDLPGMIGELSELPPLSKRTGGKEKELREIASGQAERVAEGLRVLEEMEPPHESEAETGQGLPEAVEPQVRAATTKRTVPVPIETPERTAAAELDASIVVTASPLEGVDEFVIDRVLLGKRKKALDALASKAEQAKLEANGREADARLAVMRRELEKLVAEEPAVYRYERRDKTIENAFALDGLLARVSGEEGGNDEVLRIRAALLKELVETNPEFVKQVLAIYGCGEEGHARLVKELDRLGKVEGGSR